MKYLYIDIPFCKSECFCCDLTRYCNKDNLIDEYVKALSQELLFDVLRSGDHWSPLFASVYFGGGTPSYIDSKYIKEIMSKVKCDGEVTLELNPGTITREKIKDYKEAGINRLSIGLQVADDNLLKRIGRIHTVKEFEEAYNMAREEGFTNISVDLMFGLPGEKLEDVKKSVEYLIKLNPEHVSCYSLILHEELRDKNPEAFKDLPSDEEEREMYYLICNSLKEAGYVQYEISNFAKPGFESKHNLCYWNQDEYYGIGAGASSYIDGVRYKNIDDIEQYVAATLGRHVNQNVAVVLRRHGNETSSYRIIEETQTPDSKLREYMILRLRLLDGVSKNEAFKRFNVDIEEHFKAELSKLMAQGLLERAQINDDIKYHLSQKGLDLANIVWEEFV